MQRVVAGRTEVQQQQEPYKTTATLYPQFSIGFFCSRICVLYTNYVEYNIFYIVYDPIVCFPWYFKGPTLYSLEGKITLSVSHKLTIQLFIPQSWQPIKWFVISPFLPISLAAWAGVVFVDGFVGYFVWYVILIKIAFLRSAGLALLFQAWR